MKYNTVKLGKTKSNSIILGKNQENTVESDETRYTSTKPGKTPWKTRGMPEASSESSITGPFTIKKKSGRQNAQHDRGGLQSALGVSRPLASGLHRPPPIETKKKKAKRRKENANAALERLEQRTSHGRRYRVFLPSFFFLCLVSFGGNVRTELPPRVSMGRYGVLMVSDRVIYVLRLCVCVCVCVCVWVCVCSEFRFTGFHWSLIGFECLLKWHQNASRYESNNFGSTQNFWIETAPFR